MSSLRQFYSKTYYNTYLKADDYTYTGDVPGYTTKLINNRSETYYVIAAPAGHKIIKLGYCCEPRGCGHKPGNDHADWPIFITQANSFEDSKVTEIEVGKTFMYEAIENDNDLYITKIEVPRNLCYSLDYVID